MRKFKCSGCHVYESKKEDEFASCNHVPHIKDYECPCISCLVKGMCNKVCEDFISYLAWIDKNYPHMLKRRSMLHDTLLREVIEKQREGLVYKPFIKSEIKYNGK